MDPEKSPVPQFLVSPPVNMIPRPKDLQKVGQAVFLRLTVRMTRSYYEAISGSWRSRSPERGRQIVESGRFNEMDGKVWLVD